jgi:hypothetical protein
MRIFAEWSPPSSFYTFSFMIRQYSMDEAQLTPPMIPMVFISAGSVAAGVTVERVGLTVASVGAAGCEEVHPLVARMSKSAARRMSMLDILFIDFTSEPDD